jgi:hypothetical protein
MYLCQLLFVAAIKNEYRTVEEYGTTTTTTGKSKQGDRQGVSHAAVNSQLY